MGETKFSRLDFSVLRQQGKLVGGENTTYAAGILQLRRKNKVLAQFLFNGDNTLFDTVNHWLKEFPTVAVNIALKRYHVKQFVRLVLFVSRRTLDVIVYQVNDYFTVDIAALNHYLRQNKLAIRHFSCVFI